MRKTVDEHLEWEFDEETALLDEEAQVLHETIGDDIVKLLNLDITDPVCIFFLHLLCSFAHVFLVFRLLQRSL